MNDLLENVELDNLTGETRELAETIGIDAFRRLVVAYGGTGRLYIPVVHNVVTPVRNRLIYQDYTEHDMTVSQLAVKYRLSDGAIRKIIKNQSVTGK